MKHIVFFPESLLQYMILISLTLIAASVIFLAVLFFKDIKNKDLW